MVASALQSQGLTGQCTRNRRRSCCYDKLLQLFCWRLPPWCTMLRSHYLQPIGNRPTSKHRAPGSIEGALNDSLGTWTRHEKSCLTCKCKRLGARVKCLIKSRFEGSPASCTEGCKGPQLQFWKHVRSEGLQQASFERTCFPFRPSKGEVPDLRKGSLAHAGALSLLRTFLRHSAVFRTNEQSGLKEAEADSDERKSDQRGMHAALLCNSVASVRAKRKQVSGTAMRNPIRNLPWHCHRDALTPKLAKCYSISHCETGSAVRKPLQALRNLS